MKDVLGKLGKLGKVKVYEMPPRDPVAVDFINESVANLKEALKRGEEYCANPRFNLRGKCPHCGSRKYFALYGGRYNRRCASCGREYNICI